MLIEERFTVKAPLREVWDFLMDPEKLAPCVPGCQSIEKLDDKNYLSAVQVKVGPISVTFKFKTTIVEQDFPKYLKTTAEGADIAGRFKQETTIHLEELPSGETALEYKSEVRVVGRLATFGDRIMRAKAKEMGEQFARAVKESLEKTGEE